MKSLRLGQTNLVVSRVGFGGIPIQRVTEEQAVQVVRRCIDLGITFFDTANAYSNSEERIGKALGKSLANVIIATKTYARDRTTACEHLDLSLKRLRTDCIDLWQFHDVSTAEAYEQLLGPDGAMQAAQQARKQGKVRHIGITTHSLDIALEAVPSGHFETIQFPFNFVTNEAKINLIPLANKNDVGFIAMKPFAGGMLEEATLAIKYVLQYENVLPDPGIEQPSEIEEIVAIANGSLELTPEEQKKIERIRSMLGTRFCRRCGYCQPCPEGVRIRFLMNLESFWKRFPRERLIEGDFAAAAKSGNNCIQCGTCEERCPYHLPIREILQEKMELQEELLRQKD